jgi:short-subunit dehydrogenase
MYFILDLLYNARAGKNNKTSLYGDRSMSNHPVILITGASSGIGKATAMKFANEGYRVVLTARRFDRLQILSEKINASGGEAYPIAADLARVENIQLLVNTVLEKFDQIDILFNNAGFGRLSWLDNLDPIEDIEAQILVNLLGVIQTTRLILPSMIVRRHGHIINMASFAGLFATPTYSIYAASKFGVRGFSEALRREVGIYNIRVSVIYPGAVDTEFRSHARINRKTGITTPSFLRLNADQVADAVWQLVRHPKRSLIIPSIYRLAFMLNSLFPGLLDRIIEKRFVLAEREQD